MTTASEILRDLSAPFPAEAISWRVGATNGDKTSGIALAYIDARDVMDRLDEVVGCGCWGDSYVETRSGRILCGLSIEIDGAWVLKTDGAGSTDFEGEKGGISDAFKRAAVKYGVGRYLYRLGAEWVPIKRRGKSFVIDGNPPELPSWALPGTQAPPEPAQQEEPEEEPRPKRNDPIKEMGKKLDILTEDNDEQEVRAFFNMFLKQCDCVPQATRLDDLRQAQVTDQWLAYNTFKVKANQAFDAGFTEG